ncbi:MAG: FadR/GntR family transcriptional regulator [Christensenellales bacterium]
MEPIIKVSTTDQVIESIKAHIASAGYEIGDKLPSENSLSRELQVGRSTVREALRVLQAMGYISIVHGKGAFLISASPQTMPAEHWFAENTYEVADLYSVRRAIESLAVKLAAVKMTNAEINRLKVVHEQFVSCFNDDNPGRDANQLAALDERFHTYLIEGSHNPLVITIAGHLTDALRLYRKNVFSIVENQDHTIIPHQEILNAIAARSPERAVAALENHLNLAMEDIEEAAERGRL